MATNLEVKALVTKFPALSASDIANTLKCRGGYVRSTLRRLGLTASKYPQADITDEDIKRTQKRVDALKLAREYVKGDQFLRDTSPILKQKEAEE